MRFAFPSGTFKGLNANATIFALVCLAHALGLYGLAHVQPTPKPETQPRYIQVVDFSRLAPSAPERLEPEPEPKVEPETPKPQPKPKPKAQPKPKAPKPPQPKPLPPPPPRPLPPPPPRPLPPPPPRPMAPPPQFTPPPRFAPIPPPEPMAPPPMAPLMAAPMFPAPAAPVQSPPAPAPVFEPQPMPEPTSAPSEPTSAPSEPAAPSASPAEGARAPNAAPPEDEGPIVPASHIGDYLNNPKPAYPPESVARQEQGSVRLRVTVEPNGKPSNVRIVRSSGYVRLDRAAKAAVERAWTFKPATRGGKPIRFEYVFAIKFSLQDI